MASKLRNMSYKKKKRETTEIEIGVVTEEEVGHGAFVTSPGGVVSGSECRSWEEGGPRAGGPQHTGNLDPDWLNPTREPQEPSGRQEEKMKFSGESEILGLQGENLMINSWTNGDHLLIDGSGSGSHKLVLGDDDSSDSKSAMDDLDLLLTSQSSEPNNNLAELKPLPPFTGYTGHLSINGISGHHYHTIAAAPSPPALEANNNSSEAANQNAVYYTADPVVSSSTVDCGLETVKTESVDYNTLLAPDIEDIAAIIGSAIADTTVPGNNGNGGGGGGGGGGSSSGGGTGSGNPNNGDGSRDSWIDIDAWIDSACGQGSASHNGKPQVISAESLQEFVANSQFGVASPPLAYHQQQQQQQVKQGAPYMPLLQSRLQNGPPKGGPTLASTYGLVSECPSPSSSTPYLAHSPPGHVVSTSDLVRYNPVHSSTRPSPELQVSFPHTTTPGKKSKSKSKSKAVAAASSTVVYSESGLGKEKPVHRCTICNRGFLNKSNIKVHLRTHTGEKPFRCEVCGKAFRQKAHLIKHAQIHKRIGRD